MSTFEVDGIEYETDIELSRRPALELLTDHLDECPVCERGWEARPGLTWSQVMSDA